jgi:hypothetical protein
MTLAGTRELVELAESYADGLTEGKTLGAARAQLAAHLQSLYQPAQEHADVAAGWLAVQAAWSASDGPSTALADWRGLSRGMARALVLGGGGWTPRSGAVEHRERRKLADFIRDIFGNPFRPVTFSPDWRTGTVLTLARQMYESRDFSAMPILADALQDAGCDEPAILAHCRDTSLAHVRGCWVVDLVLGKQ